MTRASVELFRVLLDTDCDWHAQAACRGCGAGLFFSEKIGEGQRTDGEAAKALCHTCPVQTRCLEYAINNHETHGVWGGTSERERRPLRRNRKAVA